MKNNKLKTIKGTRVKLQYFNGYLVYISLIFSIPLVYALYFGKYSEIIPAFFEVLKMNLPKRKQNRLQNYDYSSSGAYFITICTQNREQILCDFVGDGALDVPKTVLTDIGRIVDKHILSTNNIPSVTVDKYVIMPNHIHVILIVDNNGTSKAPSPTNNIISHSVSTLKRFINKEIGYNIFQRSFHDHVIRDQNDYLKIRNYIDTNPAKWQEDQYYK